MPATQEGMIADQMMQGQFEFLNARGEVENPQGLADFLGFDKKALAGAAGLPRNSVNLSQDIPIELSRLFKSWAVLLRLVAHFFEGNLDKTAMWFNTPNYLLGGLEPREYLVYGREQKLREIIQNTFWENRI